MICGKIRVGFLAIGVVSLSVRTAPVRHVTSALSRAIRPMTRPVLAGARYAPCASREASGSGCKVARPMTMGARRSAREHARRGLQALQTLLGRRGDRHWRGLSDLGLLLCLRSIARSGGGRRAGILPALPRPGPLRVSPLPAGIL